jgi:hypothetical protein
MFAYVAFSSREFPSLRCQFSIRGDIVRIKTKIVPLKRSHQKGRIEMSGAQRDDNIGIDSELRNSDPAEYHRQLNAKLKEQDKLWGADEKSENEKVQKGSNPNP